VRSIAISMCVCLYVYLSARISHKPHIQTSQNIFLYVCAAVARSSSDDNAIHHALPVLWMTGRRVTPRGGECTRPVQALPIARPTERPTVATIP